MFFSFGKPTLGENTLKWRAAMAALTKSDEREEIKELVDDYLNMAEQVGFAALQDVEYAKFYQNGCVSYPLKVALEFARKMKEIEDNHLMMSVRVEELGYYKDIPVVRELIEEHESDDFEGGRHEGEFCDDYYAQRLDEEFDDIFQYPRFEFDRCVDLDEVANGKVGKILWRVARAAVQLKSTTEFLRKEAGKSRYAPGSFLQIAADAAEAGDERLELCAKRAFEHDVFVSNLRRKFNEEIVKELQEQTKRDVEALMQ